MFGNKTAPDAAKHIVQSSSLFLLIRKHELAKQLNVAPKTIERWLKKGLLPTPFKTETGRTIGWSDHQLKEWKINNFKT